MLKIENFFTVYYQLIMDLDIATITINNKEYLITTMVSLQNKNIAYISLSHNDKRVCSFEVIINDIEENDNNNNHNDSFKFSLSIDDTIYKYDVTSSNDLYESVLTDLVSHIKNFEINNKTLNIDKQRLFGRLGLEKF